MKGGTDTLGSGLNPFRTADTAGGRAPIKRPPALLISEGTQTAWGGHTVMVETDSRRSLGRRCWRCQAVTVAGCGWEKCPVGGGR